MEKNRAQEGEQILQVYKSAKAALEKRMIGNEEWYKMRHWEQIRGRSGDYRAASAWLFNSLANKHADAMDNFPQPSFLPRERGDQEDAAALSKIVPVLLEQNEFEQVYSDSWWDKLKSGTAVYGIYWNPKKENGLGDIDIQAVDILNLFWEPGIQDIQQSRNIFHIELCDLDLLQEQYPSFTFAGSGGLKTAEYIHDGTIDTSQKCVVVDWYYKVSQNGIDVLHYTKFSEGNVLFSSEEGGFEKGFYAHGLYPFVFDVLFSEKDSPAGFGYVDIMKDAQISIDNMWHSFEKNVKWNAEPRYFTKQGAGINKEQFADLGNSIVDYTGSMEDVQPIRSIPVGGIAANLYQMKIDELKETSSNRDFSQGSTSSGVTAASAIAALQEAGSKTSRDMIKSAYRAFVRINQIIIELIRQFYDTPREFRIVGEGGMDFVGYDNQNIRAEEGAQVMGVAVGGRKPIFDIKISSQKSSPFSRMAQNELAKELYGAGLFNPELTDQALICLEMMDFEGKEDVVSKVRQNGGMMEMIAQMQMQIQQMAGVIDTLTGKDLTGAVGGEMETPMPTGGEAGGAKTPEEAAYGRRSGIVEKARTGAREGTAVQ